MGISVFPPVIFRKNPRNPAPNVRGVWASPGRTRGPVGWEPALCMLCAGVQEEGGVELYGDMSTMPPREAANFMPVGACLREGP